MIDFEFENRCGDEFRDSGDYAEAVKCYRRAAAADCPHAAFKLGQMYYQGLGVTRDYRLAAVLFLRAAEENIAEARDSLAALFRYGRYVPVDHSLSQAWLDVGESVSSLMSVLNRTLRFIEPEMIDEALQETEPFPGETPPPPEPEPYITPELREQGYAAGVHGRSTRIRRSILGLFGPVEAIAMLESMIAINENSAVLTDLTADLHFLRKQQEGKIS